VPVPLDVPQDPGDRVRQLEQAVQLLAEVADAGDADLAKACRDVLGSLRLHRAATVAPPEADDPPRSGRGRTPLPPPRWARGSIVEDGGIVHETVSPLHPTIKASGVNGWDRVATDVSLSATDLLIDGRWIRTSPTLQVEGGSYDLDGAHHLRDALDQLLAVVEDSAPEAASP
jgi:hypothetical protein